MLVSNTEGMSGGCDRMCCSQEVALSPRATVFLVRPGSHSYEWDTELKWVRNLGARADSSRESDEVRAGVTLDESPGKRRWHTVWN